MTHPIPSFLIARMKTSILMNGVFVPFSQALDNVQRFCRPLAAHNEGSHYDISLYGSAFLFRVRDKNLMICSKHQVVNSKRDPSELLIILGEGGNAVGVTPSSVAHVSVLGSNFNDVGDIFLAEFQSGPSGRDISGSFFQIDLEGTADLRVVERNSVTLIFAVGYPSRLVDIESTYADDYVLTDVAIFSRWAKLYLKEVPSLSSDIPGLVPLELHDSYDVDLGDPDGFSGAPVFFIYQDKEHVSHLGFAGMITFASKLGRFNMVDASYIREAVSMMN